MPSEHKTLPQGWIAFAKHPDVELIVELKKDGKYYGQLDVISKPTKDELLSKLAELKYNLPKQQ